MATTKKKEERSRYDEIVERLAELDKLVTENSKTKDKLLAEYRERQRPLNKEMAYLNRELIKVIKADPERAAKYQAPGK